ncbi:unnamed protein product [Zymoseptoria tritici ST99CH_3D7]|uniref:Uncharacterized protein n=1 Tax=Zymoseptoria tritici (strain ST99CH_3D7) TaxID=1276538 RepID=A0A1X7S535_ZYMT9|nr:unnamed protein product [Zymoseptoria tritici ST99CH_3D7]
MADPADDEGNRPPNNQTQSEILQDINQNETACRKKIDQLKAILDPLSNVDMNVYTHRDPTSQMRQLRLHAANARPALHFAPDVLQIVEQHSVFASRLGTRARSDASGIIANAKDDASRQLHQAKVDANDRRIRADQYAKRITADIEQKQREAQEHLTKTSTNHAQSRVVVDAESLLRDESSKLKDTKIEEQRIKIDELTKSLTAITLERNQKSEKVTELSAHLKTSSESLTKANNHLETVRVDLTKEKATSAGLQGEVEGMKQGPTQTKYDAKVRQLSVMEEQLLQYNGIEPGEIVRVALWFRQQQERSRPPPETPSFVSGSTPAQSTQSSSMMSGLSPAPYSMPVDSFRGSDKTQPLPSPCSSSGFPSAPPSTSSSMIQSGNEENHDTSSFSVNRPPFAPEQMSFGSTVESPLPMSGVNLPPTDGSPAPSTQDSSEQAPKRRRTELGIQEEQPTTISQLATSPTATQTPPVRPVRSIQSRRKGTTRPSNPDKPTAHEMFAALDFWDVSKGDEDKRSPISQWPDTLKAAVHPHLTEKFCASRESLTKMSSKNIGEGRKTLGLCAQAKLGRKGNLSTEDLGNESCRDCQHKRLVCVRSRNNTKPMAVPLPAHLRVGKPTDDIHHWVLEGPAVA